MMTDAMENRGTVEKQKPTQRSPTLWTDQTKPLIGMVFQASTQVIEMMGCYATLVEKQTQGALTIIKNINMIKHKQYRQQCK